MLTAELAAAFAAPPSLMSARVPARLDHLLTGPGADWQPRKRIPRSTAATTGIRRCTCTGCWSACCARIRSAFGRGRRDPLLDAHLAPGTACRERARCFDAPGGSTFERPYGWAWLLELQAEALRLGPRPAWARALQPLAANIAGPDARASWQGAPYPMRAGTHGNTAFACILALDYARRGSAAARAAIDAAAQVVPGRSRCAARLRAVARRLLVPRADRSASDARSAAGGRIPHLDGGGSCRPGALRRAADRRRPRRRQALPSRRTLPVARLVPCALGLPRACREASGGGAAARGRRALRRRALARHRSLRAPAPARQLGRPHQELVHRARALPAFADRPHHQRLAAAHVAGGEHLGHEVA